MACQQFGCTNPNSDNRVGNKAVEAPKEQSLNAKLIVERTNSNSDDSNAMDSNLIISATNKSKALPYHDPEQRIGAIEKTLSEFLSNQRVEQIELDSLLSLLFSEIDGSHGEESTELMLQFIMDHPALFGTENVPSEDNFKQLCFVLKEWHDKECNAYFSGGTIKRE